ncbi:hypothetical protein FHR81_002781 [Actinoalloteichus hoggarensis]|uniref:Uncharacterized protein n=1 Tax=Actinoalloteichus hoggarensis TaxID=1470176 RepID=A0A221VY15_9PSEU|nr:hypothetical protein [Actinoalloteichus hoggarensis]ASO18377.1 hypothetical protein AHOG_03600 [Actinoalloteichus hoggarensis]MBB5921741.1 hypothetical protein [Actinoalloteichus hoggarensis]
MSPALPGDPEYLRVARVLRIVGVGEGIAGVAALLVGLWLDSMVTMIIGGGLALSFVALSFVTARLRRPHDAYLAEHPDPDPPVLREATGDEEDADWSALDVAGRDRLLSLAVAALADVGLAPEPRPDATAVATRVGVVGLGALVADVRHRPQGDWPESARRWARRVEAARRPPSTD